MHLPLLIGLLFMAFALAAQPNTDLQKFAGFVRDINNISVWDATVTISGTTAITATNTASIFSIIVKLRKALDESFDCYKLKQLKLSMQTHIDSLLVLPLTNMNEIVVTAYTGKRVKEVNYSLAKVKSKGLQLIQT